MNGAESLVRSLLAAGVDTCFANPGTSEMHFVAALDRVPGMRCVLGLFEGVATGAADGFARMAGRPAATLLHCGPGLANGLANLHNARRAGSPVVNLVGDQATHHRRLDAPLTADTEGFARGVSDWVRTASAAERVGQDAVCCVQAARTGRGQVATLVLPSDTCWGPGGVVAEALAPPPRAHPAPAAVAQMASLLRRETGVLLLLAGHALRAAPLRLAAGIAAATGALLLAQQSNARIERGAGRVPIGRVPYPVDEALAALAGVRHAVLVGARPPVGFFAYPGKPGPLLPDGAAVHVLARPDDDGVAALQALAEALGAAPADTAPAPAVRAGVPGLAVGRAVASVLPEQAIVVDESVSQGGGVFAGTADAAPHDWLQITGGAIGCGLPLATGAAMASPGRRVVSLQADGSAMYTLQALWTQARETLDVTTVILANRRYAILQHELTATGAHDPDRHEATGQVVRDMMELRRPDLDWVKLAEGQGVPAATAADPVEMAALLAASARRRGPFLIALDLP